MSGDLISRDAVLDIDFHKLIHTTAKPAEMIKQKIEQLPPVNQQEHSRDMEEIAEIMKCDADAETKCKMISNILTTKPHYFEEQEPKTGHWKRISIDKYSEHAKYWYRCDRCGKDNLGNTDWCPNCGCRMVEPQESEGSDADSN